MTDRFVNIHTHRPTGRGIELRTAGIHPWNADKEDVSTIVPLLGDVQAVGGAVGNNDISLIIPCHRVAGANGSLTGYAGGVDKKIKLLELERADMKSFFVPKKGTAL